MGALVVGADVGRGVGRGVGVIVGADEVGAGVGVGDGTIDGRDEVGSGLGLLLGAGLGKYGTVAPRNEYTPPESELSPSDGALTYACEQRLSRNPLRNR